MKKVLTVVGSTGSGKTSLALEIANLHKSKLISADSRQIYKGLDIVTGKDHPEETIIECIDIVGPDAEYSVSRWNKLAIISIKKAWKENNLPIIIGGTGLYLKSLTDGIETANIMPNKVLRSKLNLLSLKELQTNLKELNLDKFNRLNNSDKNNPRRLVRAIEIEMSNGSNKSTALKANYLHIVLIPKDLNVHKNNIKKRVLKRIEEGAIEEAKRIYNSFPHNLPSLTACGYKHLFQYIENRISLPQLIEDWTKDEFSYSKRQITWFKRLKNGHIFDPYSPSSTLEIVKLVNNWYIK